MNARTNTANLSQPAAVPRPTGRQPNMPRRLVMTELQHHARNMRFTPHSTPAGLSPHQLASATGLDLKSVRSALNNMSGAGQAVNTGTNRRPTWRLTTPADIMKANTPMTITDSTPYTCPELKRNPGIPASRFAAFDLPSLVNGKRVPPKRPAAMCVGMLADRSNTGR